MRRLSCEGPPLTAWFSSSRSQRTPSPAGTLQVPTCSRKPRAAVTLRSTSQPVTSATSCITTVGTMSWPTGCLRCHGDGTTSRASAGFLRPSTPQERRSGRRCRSAASLGPRPLKTTYRSIPSRSGTGQAGCCPTSTRHSTRSRLCTASTSTSPEPSASRTRPTHARIPATIPSA